MEKANKQVGSSSSSSSFTVDLFGPKDSSPTSGFFGSIFDPPTSMVPGRGPLPQDFNGYGNAKHGTTTTDYKSEKNMNPIKKEKYDENGRSSSSVEPAAAACYYNSSIYYGGQEVYSPTTNTPQLNNVFKKDGDQNESNSSDASRGNWWQGSLYY